ncbi:MAG: ribosome small subunit-dependent GTPase A [Gammaproteobacteria bacterium]|nr:ribosome small subunit-dependent GTPase A [Gammaproteobacteria bacterium]
MSTAPDDTVLTGRVVAAYGRQVEIEDEQQQRFRCMMRGRKLRPVCADEVQWQRNEDDGVDGVVTRILPRRAALERPDRRGRVDTLASNITQLVIVFAPRPEVDYGIVDRYLVAGELIGVAALLVANKRDLDRLDTKVYEDIGYPVVSVSAKQPESLGPLAEHLNGHTSILVGQSGVGKSSLLNALIPGLDVRTQTVSAGSGEGRHTTTASMLHHLEQGGDVIDSPGVRDYAPPPVDEAQLAHGYREIADAAADCRFHNCRHLSEPNCAVKNGVDEGRISRERYASYRHLLQRMASLGNDYS